MQTPKNSLFQPNFYTFPVDQWHFTADGGKKKPKLRVYRVSPSTCSPPLFLFQPNHTRTSFLGTAQNELNYSVQFSDFFVNGSLSHFALLCTHFCTVDSLLITFLSIADHLKLMRKFKKSKIVAHINKVSDQTPAKTRVDTED